MTAAGRTSRRRGRLGRGYTAVEVMLAITVLLISTAGVMAMQTASIQGNLDARKLDVANRSRARGSTVSRRTQATGPPGRIP